MFVNFNSINTNGNGRLDFPTASRMFINGNGIQTDGGQVTSTNSSSASFVKATNIMSSNNIQLFPITSADQPGVNIQGNVLGVLPNAPSVPTVANNIAGHFGEIQVSFTAPSGNSGSNITGYKVYAYLSGNIVNVDGISGVSSPIYYTGLTQGNAYTFKVSAINGTGEGPLSSASSSIVVPGQPSTPALSSTVTSSLSTLQVTVTSSPSFLSSGYKYSTDDGATWSSSLYSSPITISQQSNNGANLSANTSYTIRVKEVVLLVFESNPSTSVTGITLPGVPTLSSVTAPAGQQQTLRITYSGASGGTATVSYQYTTDNGSSWKALGASPADITQTSVFGTTALSANTDYTIRIRAGNGTVNTGGFSAASTLPGTTCPTLPGAPQSVVVSVPSTSATLTVTYTAPSPLGTATISSYQYSTDSGSTWAALGSSPGSVNISQTSSNSNLVNGTSYTVSVRALNNNDQGAGAATTGNAATPVAPTTLYADFTSYSYNVYPSTANPVPLGTTWSGFNGNELVCTGATISYTTSPLDFTMTGSNYWQGDYPRPFSLYGPVYQYSNTLINIWTKANYSTPGSFTPALLYKFNGETASSWNAGYMIGGTPSGSGAPFQFTFGVRNANINTATIPLATWQTGYSSATVSTSYTKGTWYMVTLVANNMHTANTTFTLYVNGGTSAGGVGDKMSLQTTIDTTAYDDEGQSYNNYATVGNILSNKTPNGVTAWAGDLSGMTQYTSPNNFTDAYVASLFNSQKSAYNYTHQ